MPTLKTALPEAHDRPASCERLFSIPEAREALGGLSRSALYELFARGDLPSVKLGSRRLVRSSDLEAFVKALPVVPLGEGDPR